jgi:exonuclease SbcC
VDQVTALERAKQELPERVAALEARLCEARVAAAGLDAAKQRLAAVDKQRAAAEALAGLAPLLAEAAAAEQAAVDAHQRRTDEHLGLIEARLTGMAAELAAELAEGGPCPVCGSAAHPQPAVACEALVSPEDVSQAWDRREAAEGRRRHAEAEHAALAMDAAAYEAVSEGRDLAGLAAEVADLTAQVAEAEAALGDCRRLEPELTDARAEADGVARALRAAEKATTVARKEADQAQESLDRLRAELADAAGEHPSVSARQAALRQSAAAGRALAKALGAIAASLADEARARERVAAEAQARGFATPEEAAAAMLTGPEQAGLAAEVMSWDETLAKLAAAAQAPELAGFDPGDAAQAAARALAASAVLAQAQADERAARGAHEAVKVKAGRLAQRSEEVRAAAEAQDRLAAGTEAVIHLAGLASGTEGHRRVALTTYVLRHWFGQVVAAANVRLSAMSSGRYELRRTDEGKSRRDRSGLTLAVIDRHTGAERSPASLSGGETFYTSLALALGLADVVRAQAGGVDLDTLFIDEGFGSLDADTLDQVMGVIDDLRDRGRVIGIVSHVTDLKDRVPERLEVRRLPDGSSAVKVVA